MQTSTITLDVDPNIHVGPLDVAWHGLMIAVGIAAGAWLATRYARKRGLSPQKVLDLVLIAAVAGLVGSRALYLLLNHPSSLLRPGDWVGTRGFAFYGALVLAVAAVAWYARRGRLDLRYLDALAVGFPLGLAVGRVGDVISGEHYGPATTLPWGVRYVNSHAEVPNHVQAFHQGGLYELVLGLLMLAVLWALRHRVRRPTMILWTVIALYSAGRFVMFFWRSDTTGFLPGINTAQAVSLLLLAGAIVGARVRASADQTVAPVSTGAGSRERSEPALACDRGRAAAGADPT